MLLYLTANNIADDNAYRRDAIFLSDVGRDIYQVLSDLCSSDKAASKTLDQLLMKTIASPLAFGSYGLDITCVNPHCSINDLNSEDKNWGALSETSSVGMPNRAKMSFSFAMYAAVLSCY